MTAEALQGERFEVIEAADGDEAVELLDGPSRFGVLFTDVRMPPAVLASALGPPEPDRGQHLAPVDRTASGAAGGSAWGLTTYE